ncbi:MAG: hypothetical protein WCP30_15760, partial [Mycobacteriaceae bacterium]
TRVGKPPKLKVLDVADVPLREVSGLALRGGQLLAVGDHDPVVFSAVLEPWPLRWQGTDLAELDLPEGGVQFEALEPAGEHTVLVLQEQPARVLHIDLARPALVGTLLLDVPEGHRLREAWLGDRSSRGESLLLAQGGHLLVVKEKDPPAILEFGPPGDAPVGWRRGVAPVPPAPGDAALTVLATWWLGEEMQEHLPDISDATVGPDGRLYLLSDKGSAIARLPDLLDPQGGTVEPVAVWRIAGKPQNPEGLVILADGTVLVGLDTKSPRRNLLRLQPLPLE